MQLSEEIKEYKEDLSVLPDQRNLLSVKSPSMTGIDQGKK